MELTFTVSNSLGFTNVDYIKITFWDTSEKVYNDPDSNIFHATFYWMNSLGEWVKPVGADEWQLENDSLPQGSSTNTIEDFTLKFSISDDAKEESANYWAVVIFVTNGTSIAKTNYYSMYKEISGEVKGEFFTAPNPLKFTGSISQIKFMYDGSLADKAKVTIRIYDMNGKLVRIRSTDGYELGPGYLLDNKLGITWDGKNGQRLDVISGNYVALMELEYANGNKFEKEFDIVIIR